MVLLGRRGRALKKEKRKNEALRQTLENIDQEMNHYEQLKKIHAEMEEKIIQLQSAVEERESQIFSLQPYQRQFGTNEAMKVFSHFPVPRQR